MNKLKSIFSKYPLYVLLLPAFYFIHGYAQFIELDPAKSFLLQCLFYTVIVSSLYLVFKFFYKNNLKAGLATILLASVYLFFGNLRELLRDIRLQSFFTSYTFFIPFLSLSLLVAIWFIKKSKYSFSKISSYLNLLFILLISIDLVSILNYKYIKKNPNAPSLIKNFKNCTPCNKPDIYFILTDEYSGKSTLKDIFTYDNSLFENELKKRGFHITNNSFSNYNSTVYSMASLFNMNYLAGLKKNYLNNPDILSCRSIIRDNNLTDFLKLIDYDIVNISFFEFGNKTRGFASKYFPSAMSMLNKNTLLGKIEYELGAHFASREKIESIIKWNLNNSVAADSLLRLSVKENSKKPKLVYAHFPMPHHPYFYDSTGNETPIDSLSDNFKLNKTSYIEYLAYTNKKFLSLIDYIQSQSKSQAIIILVSDHGFRQYVEDVDSKYYFLNLNAIFLPGQNYSQFYDGMSNVNFFRALLNTQFNQQLPFLKDSSVFLKDWKN